MSPTQLAVRYRGYAAQCLIVAQHQDGAADKTALITMAQAWVALADQLSGHRTLAVDETPEILTPD